MHLQTIFKNIKKLLPDKIVYSVLTFSLILLFDQVSKWIVLYCLEQGQTIKVLSFFDIVLVFNYGISFGMFQSQGMLGVWFFSTLSLILCGWIIIQIKNSKHIHELVSYSLIMGGAIGNVFDRIIHGGVVDFLSFHLQNRYWPAFNIADSAIVVGAILILAIELWQSNIKGSKPQANSKRKKRK